MTRSRSRRPDHIEPVVEPTLPTITEPIQPTEITTGRLNTHRRQNTSDSDSDSYPYHAYTPRTMSSSKTARVDQPAFTKPPFLTPGDITPEVLRNWEIGCRQYFKHKGIPAEEQVGKVAWGMQEPTVQEWYIVDQERLDKLTFDAYMAEVRAYWLPTDWADTTRQKMLSSFQGNKTFNDWAIEIQGQNALLRGTPSHMTELALRHHLEAHMQPDLRIEYLRTWHAR